MARRTINVDRLARVEGEGALEIFIGEGVVEDVKLNIFEPPRFFEAFLRGRHYTEAPDLTARICGICPIAYQMSAVHAMESIAGVTMPDPIRNLRRILYCGEWIESHALHVFMLHAPDFLGFDDAIDMAKAHPDIVKSGLRIKQAGNAIVTLVGGREIHPVNVRVGGFYRWPRVEELAGIREKLLRASDDTASAFQWARRMEFPDIEIKRELVALHHDTDYPFCDGLISSTSGTQAGADAFLEGIDEFQAPHSTALHARQKGKGAYLTGPLARFNLNRDQLTPAATASVKQAGLVDGCFNPFKSLLVRLIEIQFAFEEALRLIEALEQPDTPFFDFEMRAGSGAAATEAPRGLLVHQYRVDAEGLIANARIVPPTSQNQPSIEADVRRIAQQNTHEPDEVLTRICEQAVRNHDPCISCATHFLRVTINRDGAP